jgi:transcriptional regulator
MYIPSAYEVTDPAKIAEVISAYSFGILVSKDGDSLVASHLPFVYQPQPGRHGRLTSHLAKANRHWQLFNERDEALVIFHGPHAYISPSFYVSEVAVPTWNYVSVHVYGHARVMTSDAELNAVLDETVAQHEAGRPSPWTADRLPDEMEARLHQALVGFTMEITRVEAKFKLGQNRSKEDQAKMLALLQNAPDSESRRLAEFMAREIPG